MKYLFLMAATLFSVAIGAEIKKPIKSKPDKATVFLTGVELTHTDFISLLPGNNEITIEGTSANADESSITAYFKGAMVIDTRKVQIYPETHKSFEMELKYNSIINRIKDSLEDLGFDMKGCSNKMSALDKEKQLLLNNSMMRGTFQKDSLALLKSSLDLIRGRLNDIDDEYLIQERKYAKLTKLKTALDERLNHYTNLLNQYQFGENVFSYKVINQIVVSVDAEKEMSGNLVVKYYDPSAGWMPKYDVNASATGEKLQLIYRGQVYQNTGIDWSNISLTLSTSNPAQGNTKPLLSVWNLFYGYPQTYSYGLNKQNMGVQNYNYKAAPTLESKSLSTDDVRAEIDATASVEPAFTVSENMMNVEYDIKSKYSIASDNKAHNVIVDKVDVPVTYTFMAVPKLDNNAFLMGKVSNWEDLNLLPAMARIYFDDSYVGNTVVNPNTVRDTLYLDLGRDKSIMIKRQNLKDKCKEQIIGDDKIITKTVEISIRNTKSMSIDFELEDQIPIAGDNTIKIELLKSDGAIYNELTGKLTWKLNIKSKDTKKVVFSYQVKHPKNKFIGAL